MTTVKEAGGTAAEKNTVFDKAFDFETTLIDQYAKSERRAWSVTKLLAFISLLALIALGVLAPFYKIVPMTFVVDKVTGEAQLVKLDGGNILPTEAIDKHWIADYVNHRERFVWTLIQADFDYVMNMSDEQVGREYRSLFEGAQPKDKKLGPGTDERIQNVVVTLPPGEPGKAVVRFEKIVRRDGHDIDSGRYLATMAYKYDPPTALSKERTVVDNPMGFKVTGFVVDRDVSSPALPQQKSAAAAISQPAAPLNVLPSAGAVR